MPVKLINRQRSLARVGKIKMGERKQPNRPGFQRSTFRFTSANKVALEMLQKELGGKITFYDEIKEWELASDAGQITVVVNTRGSVDDTYEQYDGKTRTHKCDGQTCVFIEIARENKKIVRTVEHGEVPCLCRAKFQDEYEDWDGPDDEKGECYRKTTLRVMLPATEDVMLWEFQSKSMIFNDQVFALIDVFESQGLRNAYCLLTITPMERTIGNEVKKWSVAVLSLHPNPPNMVAALMSRTPEAQAMELMAGQTPMLAAPAAALPAASREPKDLTDQEIFHAHGLTQDQSEELKAKLKKRMPFAQFLREAHRDGDISFVALLRRLLKMDDGKDIFADDPEPEQTGEQPPLVE